MPISNADKNCLTISPNDSASAVRDEFAFRLLWDNGSPCIKCVRCCLEAALGCKMQRKWQFDANLLPNFLCLLYFVRNMVDTVTCLKSTLIKWYDYALRNYISQYALRMIVTILLRKCSCRITATWILWIWLSAPWLQLSRLRITHSCLT